MLERSTRIAGVTKATSGPEAITKEQCLLRRSMSLGRLQSAQKHQKSVSRKKGISKSYQSVRSEAQSRSKSKSVKSKPQLVNASQGKSSSESVYDIVFDSGSKDLSMSYRARGVAYTSMVQDVLPDPEWFRRIHVDSDSSSDVMYEHCFRNLSYRTRLRLKESRIPLVRFSGEFSYPLGVIDLEVTIGEYGKTKTVIMKFAVVKSPSPYTTLLEFRWLWWRLVPKARKGTMQLDDMEERRQLDKVKKPPKSSVEKKIVTPTDMTGIPQAITEHSLDNYPHIEPKVQKKRILAPDRRKVVTDEVNEWLKDEQTFSTLQRINIKLNPKKCSFSMEEGKFIGYILTSEGIRANLEKEKAVMDMPSPKTHKQMQSLSGKLAALGHFLSKSAKRSLPFLDTLKKYTNKKDFRWIDATEVVFLEMKKLVFELPTLTTPKKGDTLMMYLAATNDAVSTVLLTKRDGRQMPKHYVLVDFLANIPTKINATPKVASTPRMEDIAKSLNARENLTPGRRAWRLYTDGASNNRGSGVGLILIAPNDVEYSYALHLNFSNSNNKAKYEALLAGLRIATKMQVKEIYAFVDSKLIASQLEGFYEDKGERMIKYQEKVLELAGAFNRFQITHILRAENKKADNIK
uniref:RNase H type-1 domain-containing protein n=1 Tax=Tanacetum cinerariifolium TaxID=118510 RepID=A0A699HA16_TANCI|nr:hypothetical protein [Tanacetum cinerariifolium]